MNTNSSALILPTPTAETNLAELDIRDIKPPVEIPSGWEWLWWTLAALVLAALLFWAWRKWQQHLARPKLAATIPPHVRARQQLDAARGLIDQPRPFCTQVSDTLRVYLEERFQFHAPERTTEEFLLELQNTDLLSAEQKHRLADFLGRCDLVKFARYEPLRPELEDLFDSALRLVEETIPFEKPPNSTAAPQPTAQPA